MSMAFVASFLADPLGEGVDEEKQMTGGHPELRMRFS